MFPRSSKIDFNGHDVYNMHKFTIKSYCLCHTNGKIHDWTIKKSFALKKREFWRNMPKIIEREKYSVLKLIKVV